MIENTQAAPPASKRGRRLALLASKLTVTFIILAVLALRIDTQAVFVRFHHVDPFPFAVAVLLAGAQILLGAFRWHLVIRALSASIPLPHTVKLFAIGVFFNVCLPGGIGGDAYRMWSLKRASTPLSVAVSSVLLERIYMMLALFVGMIAEYPLLLWMVGDQLVIQLSFALALAGIAAIAALPVLDRLPTHWQTWRVVRGFATFARAARCVLFRIPFVACGMALSYLTIIAYSLMVYFISLCIGVDVSISDCILLIPPTIIIMLLPVTVAGWGLREAAMVLVLGAVGVAPDAALALSVMTGLIAMATGLPGGILWLLPGGSRNAAGQDTIH